MPLHLVENHISFSEAENEAFIRERNAQVQHALPKHSTIRLCRASSCRMPATMMPLRTETGIQLDTHQDAPILLFTSLIRRHAGSGQVEGTSHRPCDEVISVVRD